jgi:hypothetical protein
MINFGVPGAAFCSLRSSRRSLNAMNPAQGSIPRLVLWTARALANKPRFEWSAAVGSTATARM